MVISSKENPTIKRIASLAEKKYRREYGEYLVEGVKSVNECISAGKEITNVVCTAQYANRFPQAITVTDELFSRISTEKTPQGVLATVKIRQATAAAPAGDCLLLDRVQDPGNVGTIIRTANAAGYKDLYLVNCADPYSPKAVRASMGGIFNVNVYECTYGQAFGALEGVKIIVADMNGESVFSFRTPERFCLCIGNEANGVGEEVVFRSDHTVKVPMEKSCESLNAAVSAGILMYVLKNKR